MNERTRIRQKEKKRDVRIQKGTRWKDLVSSAAVGQGLAMYGIILSVREPTLLASKTAVQRQCNRNSQDNTVSQSWLKQEQRSLHPQFAS